MSLFYFQFIPAAAVAVVDNAVVAVGVDAAIGSAVVADAVVAVESHTSFAAVELDVLAAEAVEAADTSLAAAAVVVAVAVVLSLDTAVQAQP